MRGEGSARSVYVKRALCFVPKARTEQELRKSNIVLNESLPWYLELEGLGSNQLYVGTMQEFRDT